MSDEGLFEEAEILKNEIFSAISRLEQLGTSVIEDQVLCHAISNIRGTADRLFSDMVRDMNPQAIGGLMNQVYDEVVSLQDRVIASMEGTMQSLSRRLTATPTKGWLH